MSKKIPRVLIVDDEEDIRALLDMSLARMGIHCDAANDCAEAKRLLTQQSYDLCLTDMRLPDGTGLDLVKWIGEHHPTTPIAVITAYGSLENAVAALKAGAFDYLAKPVSLEQLRALVKTALRLPSRQSESASDGRMLLGESAPMREVRAMIEKLARSDAAVHITGESGTGKELAARLIHYGSARREKPFVAVNCGAIPENLMESEFFGYRKGAFTGAETDRDGFFHAAHEGTLFLDEVGDLPLSMQVKLLRAIQEKRVRRVGATVEEPINVRIISATHQNLRKLIEAGRFRHDLYFRLSVIELRMPALRECREDIPLIAREILRRIARDQSEPPSLSTKAIELLSAYPFPGNVRELENILERAVALNGDKKVIDAEDLEMQKEDSWSAHDAENAAFAFTIGRPLQDFLDEQERRAILEALRHTRFNRTQAARLLGVTFRSLRYRMERLGIDENNA
ncbi:MAG: sigma-54 dependent transcriptional regulator [Rhodocyclaceae bacterium]|nr:sigma-54 dependent transcriptional regulator [Rhodocyclaceae bacterium]